MKRFWALFALLVWAGSYGHFSTFILFYRKRQPFRSANDFVKLASFVKGYEN
jgi:hypothetical protein